MDNKTAASPEGVPEKLVKTGAPTLRELLTTKFNKYLNGKRLPNTWREDWIVPLHKKISETSAVNKAVFLE